MSVATEAAPDAGPPPSSATPLEPPVGSEAATVPAGDEPLRLRDGSAEAKAPDASPSADRMAKSPGESDSAGQGEASHPTQGAPAESDGAPPQAGKPAAAPDLSPAACAARLAALFPAVFAPGAFRPLKLRIQGDIQQRAPATFTRKVLSVFLHRHTTSTAYLKALMAQPHRFDLDGNAAGDIADEHRQAAAAELERRRGLHDARRAAEREAQRTANEEARRQRAADEGARRERAGLLRAFETSTLTPTNFCALKGIALDALDALLEQARQERSQPAAEPTPPRARTGERPEGREGGRPTPRSGRRDEAPQRAQAPRKPAR